MMNQLEIRNQRNVSELEAIACKLRACSSLPEFSLWSYLKDGKMYGYRFSRIQPIEHYIVDFFCPELGLVIEIDGDSHDMKYGQETQQRYQSLREHGLDILRFTNNELKKDVFKVINLIKHHIEKRE